MKTLLTTHGNPGPMDAMPGEMDAAPLDGAAHGISNLVLVESTVSLSHAERLAAIVAIVEKARRMSDQNALLLPDEVERVYALATGRES